MDVRFSVPRAELERLGTTLLATGEGVVTCRYRGELRIDFTPPDDEVEVRLHLAIHAIEAKR